MTAPPIDIPLDERGAPDLQLLVRQLGQAAVAARGEAYDPAHNPAHAGYPLITPEIWKAFDAEMATYQAARRAGLASAPPSNATDSAPPVFGPIEHKWPYVRCAKCSAEARFGYRDSDGTMRWFCAAHRLAQNWSDARRDAS
jgi:hypothetical protein